MPRDAHAYFLLYFVAETMRKSLLRASVASGPRASFCSSVLTREQNFLSSSSWISLNREEAVSDLASDSGEGPRNATLSCDRTITDAGRIPTEQRDLGVMGRRPFHHPHVSRGKLADWLPNLVPPSLGLSNPWATPVPCWTGLSETPPPPFTMTTETPHIPISFFQE